MVVFRVSVRRPLFNRPAGCSHRLGSTSHGEQGTRPSPKVLNAQICGDAVVTIESANCCKLVQADASGSSGNCIISNGLASFCKAMQRLAILPKRPFTAITRVQIPSGTPYKTNT